MRRALIVILLVVLPTSASAEERDSRALTWGLRVLDIVWSADLAVTMYGIGAGQVDELNPAYRWAQRKPIVFGIVRGGAQVGAREYIKRTKSATLAWCLVGAGVGVLAWNASQLRDGR